MKVNDLVAIDVHTRAEVSCRQPADAFWQPYEDAANRYFKAGKRPTIAETIAYYRERKIGLVMFTVDSEHEIGNRRIPNEEVAEAAAANSDMMIAFASIDPHKGKMGVREARDLIEAGVIKGFKFHPRCRASSPTTVWRGLGCRQSSTAAIPASARPCPAAACGSNIRTRSTSTTSPPTSPI